MNHVPILKLKRRVDRPLAAAILSLLLALASPTAWSALPAQVQGKALPTLAPMLERVTPAVVNIATRGRVAINNPLMEDPFFRYFFGLPQQRRERQTQGLGSGVIVDARQGYVITNHHVIAQADDITVKLNDGREFEAQLIGSDEGTDVAVVRIPPENLTAVKMTDSDALRVGDFVVAIGNPFGLGQTVTSGIVSALGRSGLGIESYEDFIQTDASINPGNSGGALVDLNGHLVGINTAILGSSGNIGIGFAIPINMARDISDQLLEHGAVRRGRLGIASQDLTPDLARAFGIKQRSGAVIVRIDPGSPAELAGLRTGDVIIAVDGREIDSASELRTAVGLLRIGEKIAVDVIRGKRKLTLRAVIGEQPVRTTGGGRFNRHLEGATLGAVESETREGGLLRGVLVADIVPGTPAAASGLRKGDIITSVNRREIDDLDDLAQMIGRGDREVLLGIVRNRAQFLVLLQ